MKYKKIITALIMCICIIVGGVPSNLAVQAAISKSLNIQMVPCGKTSTGKDFNGWCDGIQCFDGMVNTISSNVLFDGAPSDKDKLTYFFIQYETGVSSKIQFSITVDNARVETESGKIIYLDKLNGVYQKPDSGNILCDYSLDGISAGQFYNSKFKADITVTFGSLSDYGSASDSKFPSSGIVTYSDDTITLNNVNYNGTLTLTGGKKYKNGVTLRLKGNSKIKKLIVKCPITIASDGKASLTCQTVSDTKSKVSVVSNVSVKKKGAGAVYTASPITLKNLAKITYSGNDKSLPSNLYYSIEGNTITLEDFHFDGEINLTGGGYDNLSLVLKGYDSIGSLTMNCPVKLERSCYAKLTCSQYKANKDVSIDQNTSIKNVDGQTEFDFSLQSGHQYTTIFNSEEAGFNFNTAQENNETLLTNWPDLEQYEETTVTDFQDFSKGFSMTFENGSNIALDLTNKIKACATDEKVVLTFYARVVSDNPNDTAWGGTSLIPYNSLNGTAGKNAFNWVDSYPLTTKWQKFTFSGFWPATNLGDTNLSLYLGCYTGGAKVEFCGVQLLGKGSLTSSELDELTGMYDYDWRHKDAPWRAKAQKMIDSNREGDMTLSITDGSGKPLDGAKVTIKQTDYDYEFGMNCGADAIISPDGRINEYFNVLKRMGINSVIDYNSLLWEYYYDDGNSNDTFEFDRSPNGDVDFVTAAVKAAQESNTKFTAHALVYPSFFFMQSNSLYSENYDKLVAYVLSDEYSPDGFKQRIEDHISQEVESYAGVIKCWNVVNEAYGSKDFFKLIYGTDGTGISREVIKSVTKGCITNEQKITALVNWLETDVSIVPASVAGKYIAGFCDAAQRAWVDAGCNPEELILNYNDFATKVNDFNNRGKFYSYVTQIAKELAKPSNYKEGKVLIDRIGIEFCDLGVGTLSPMEIWSMLDDYDAIGLPIWATEFNYWVDNPISENGSKPSDYGTSYSVSGCDSKAEIEFIHDYGEAVITAMYAHKNSSGVLSTSYPHGQIGYFYGWDIAHISPMGEAFMELTGEEWRTPDQSGIASGGKFKIKNAALGKYEIKVTYGKVTEIFNIDLSKKTGTYLLKLKNSDIK